MSEVNPNTAATQDPWSTSAAPAADPWSAASTPAAASDPWGAAAAAPDAATSATDWLASPASAGPLAPGCRASMGEPWEMNRLGSMAGS